MAKYVTHWNTYICYYVYVYLLAAINVDILTLKVLVATIDALGHFETG